MGSPVFYVASPIGERTAGPEALTQLVDAIRRRGIEAHLIPMRNHRGRRNDPEYDIYGFDVVDGITRPDDAHLVIPEISPIESRRELLTVPVERTWMGWFSVNNSPDPRARYFRPSEDCCSTYPPGHQPDRPAVPADFGLGSGIADGPLWAEREASRRCGGLRTSTMASIAVQALSMRYARRVIDSGVRFFAQSFYAQGFVRQVLNASAPIITDPIRVIPRPAVSRSRQTVLYNRAKSWSLIEEVAARVPEAEFRAIEGMSYEQVVRALSEATMYLELGHLPGRDRMPREAAYLGTPVVCLARGAGYCWQDVPLPVEHRIEFREGWPDAAAIAVRRVLADPLAAAQAQGPYREWVADEPARYEAAVDAWLALALS